MIFNVKKIVATLCALALTTQCFIINEPISTSAAETTETKITYDINNDLLPGGSFQIDVNVENISDLYSYSLDFSYNSRIIEIDSIENGNILSDPYTSLLPSNENTFVVPSNGNDSLTSFIATMTGSVPGVSTNVLL